MAIKRPKPEEIVVKLRQVEVLKAHDLITSPAFIVIKAASEFKDKTTAINQLWQTDFTYIKVLGWGWFYLSTVLDDYSRYIASWKLCTNMRAEDVTDTLDLAPRTSGCDQVHVVHKPRLLSDNGSSYVSGDLAEWLQDKGMKHSRGAPYHPQTQGKIERWHQTATGPSCWKTTSYPVISKPRSKPSSITTIISATTRASTTSHRPTSTSDATKSFYSNVKGSNERHSKRDACITASTPHNQTNQMSQNLS